MGIKATDFNTKVASQIIFVVKIKGVAAGNHFTGLGVQNWLLEVLNGSVDGFSRPALEDAIIAVDCKEKIVLHVKAGVRLTSAPATKLKACLEVLVPQLG
jgi:hypothetical protein